MVVKLRNADKLAEEYPNILTPFELRILKGYGTKTVAKLSKDLGVSKSSIYSVFNRIRIRRKVAKLTVDFFNGVCRDRRYYQVLTPRERLPEDVI
jgi:hypothetical protein